MKITELLSDQCLSVPLVAGDKFDAISRLLDQLEKSGKLADRHQVEQAVVDRERKQATGMELGLAVPHGRSAGCAKPVMAVGLARPPVDFQAADGKPAHVIVLLVGPPDQTGIHIQALARISRLMLNEGFRNSIAEAESPAEAYHVFARYDH